jgi:hypothetical protein
MNWFDKWFAKKSKFVWDECKKEGHGLAPSKADFDFLKCRVQDLEIDLHKIRYESQTGSLARRLDLLETYLNIEVDDKPKYKLKKENPQ